MLISSQLVLGALVIAPWLLLIVYDAVLYLIRTAFYEVPIVGGRARHRPRPRAPSLSERPNGQPRTFSRALQDTSSVQESSSADVVRGVKKRLEQTGHSRSSSKVSTDE